MYDDLDWDFEVDMSSSTNFDEYDCADPRDPYDCEYDL